MEAGRELDALIAEKVMGLHRRGEYWLSSDDHEVYVADTVPADREDFLPDYSTDIAAAWLVVEKLEALQFAVSLTTDYDIVSNRMLRQVRVLKPLLADVICPVYKLDQTPLSICLAALKVIEKGS